MSRLIRLYPRAWRARYGEELQDLVDARPLGVAGAVDLIRGAIDAHRHPELVDPAVAPAGLEEAVTPARYRNLVVARRLGLGSMVGAAVWLIGIIVATSGPIIEESDGFTYRDGSAAMPVFFLAMLLLSGGCIGQLIRLPSRLVVTRLAAVIALLTAPIWGPAPWLFQVGLVAGLALVVLAVGAWWAGAWHRLSSGAVVTGIALAFGFVVLASFEWGTDRGAELLYALAMFSLTAVFIAVGWTLLALPGVVAEEAVAGPTGGPLPA